nr:MAG TPA: hypothetical protein [Caudoviricetes sp.]
MGYCTPLYSSCRKPVFLLAYPPTKSNEVPPVRPGALLHRFNSCEPKSWREAMFQTHRRHDRTITKHFTSRERRSTHC